MSTKRPASTLGERIRAARLAVGVSQARLGQWAGISDLKNASVRMNRYEKDRKPPDLATLRAIAASLGVPAAYLVTEDDEMAQTILALHNMTDRQRRLFLKQHAINPADQLQIATEEVRQRLRREKSDL